MFGGKRSVDSGSAAQPAQRLIDNGAPQPQRQRSGARERVEPLIGVQIRLLQHVLGLGVVADDAARQSVQAAVMSDDR